MFFNWQNYNAPAILECITAVFQVSEELKIGNASLLGIVFTKVHYCNETPAPRHPKNTPGGLSSLQAQCSLKRVMEHYGCIVSNMEELF